MPRPTTRLILLVVAIFLSLPTRAPAQESDVTESILTTEVGHFIGQTVTVCGPVAGTAYFSRLRGEPTFINFDRQYPEQSFTVVIWGRSLGEFEVPPDKLYADKQLCVTGRIETYKGKPQIIVTSPDQIEVQDEGLVPERFTYEERVLLKAMLVALGHQVDDGTGEWDSATAQAMADFQVEHGISDEGSRSPQTLRALAKAVEQVPSDEQQKILRLLLLNLAQREEAAARK
ncbi:MAG: peptidoglycan-binding protein [Candidatus Eisenbacteria bacterium]|uniref:Peptidoglycan-binding protein n=1 Tax=Eiseniibacteriota bacterium TaxID=2212470 RepID=A0A7Y2E919_UNCEI|nr:peptidoglycan-binding protein [Candidatus Eisenbacteria bacterium]